jgi:hypothetical protein
MPEGVSPPEDFEAQVQRVTRTLKSQGVESSDDVIEHVVRESFAERQDARIKDFVGLLVERSARERLRRLAAAAPSRTGV